MATDKSYMEFVAEQIHNAGAISYRKMFGEYAFYCDGKVVGLVCNNQLFVKPTSAGRLFVETITEAPPYPGASLYFLIEDKIEDSEWITGLVKITAQELPLPKKKLSKKKTKIGTLKC